MCGIAGIVVFDPGSNSRVGTAELVAIREAMARRGPDAAGLWVSPDAMVGLAHRRLAIIDPRPEADQPMSHDGGYRIVFNGEILNYRELRAELAAQGVACRTTSDTEVLLLLYARYGAEMVTRLRGMFAFAIWDEPRRRLFAARDPFGIKPFYFAEGPGMLRFASQVKALKAGGSLDLTPDPAGRVGFFLFGYVPEPFTLYREIRALPAGHTLTVDDGGVRLSRYFDIAAELAEASSRPPPSDPAERRRLIHDTLLDSVKHHLEADVPVGLFLSAGIDSNALMALAAEAAGPRLRSITLGFPEYRGGERDETRLAETSAARHGAEHRTCWVGAADFEAEEDG